MGQQRYLVDNLNLRVHRLRAFLAYSLGLGHGAGIGLWLALGAARRGMTGHKQTFVRVQALQQWLKHWLMMACNGS